MSDAPLAAPWPSRGLDVSRGYGHQPAGTTPRGKNVRDCEPSTMRLRGGARPGLAKYIAGQIPEGTVAFQELNQIVISSADALPTGIEDPGTITVDDPSSAGPSYSWGSGTLYFDPDTGNPVTGTDRNSRVPSPPGGGKAKRRNKGSGFQPNKNVLSPAQPPSATPKYLFTGTVTIRLHMNAPDPYNFDLQEPTFVGIECRYYNPPTIPTPGSAQTFAAVVAQRDAYLGLATVAPWLGSYEYIADSVVGPGAACTVVGSDH